MRFKIAKVFEAYKIYKNNYIEVLFIRVYYTDTVLRSTYLQHLNEYHLF